MIDVETRLQTDAEQWRERSRPSYPDLDTLLPPTRHRPGRGLARMLAIAAGVAVVGSIAAVIAVSRSDDRANPATPRSSQSSVALHPIFIDGRTFRPRRTPLPGSLSATAAWAIPTRRPPSKYRPIPSGTRIMFGQFTEPARLHDLAVWAYRLPPQDCIVTGPAIPSPWPHCSEWIFLDAHSGRLVLDTSVPD